MLVRENRELGLEKVRLEQRVNLLETQCRDMRRAMREIKSSVDICLGPVRSPSSGEKFSLS